MAKLVEFFHLHVAEGPELMPIPREVPLNRLFGGSPSRSSLMVSPSPPKATRSRLLGDPGTCCSFSLHIDLRCTTCSHTAPTLAARKCGYGADNSFR